MQSAYNLPSQLRETKGFKRFGFAIRKPIAQFTWLKLFMSLRKSIYMKLTSRWTLTPFCHLARTIWYHVFYSVWQCIQKYSIVWPEFDLQVHIIKSTSVAKIRGSKAAGSFLFKFLVLPVITCQSQFCLKIKSNMVKLLDCFFRWSIFSFRALQLRYWNLMPRLLQSSYNLISSRESVFVPETSSSFMKIFEVFFSWSFLITY